MVKRYEKHSRISVSKFREILRLFLLDIEATKVSEISNIYRSAINRLFTYFRTIIAEYCEESSIFETGEIEIDESYFGVRQANEVVVQEARHQFLVYKNEMIGLYSNC